MEQIAKWQRVADPFRIKVIAPCEIVLGIGSAFIATALVKVGPPLGMVVDPNWAVLAPHAEAFVEAGYGYSAVTIGDEDELDACRDILLDWGWVG